MVIQTFYICVLIHILQTLIFGSSLVELLLLMGTVTHTLTLLSSSFVEEEHQTFYFLATALHIFIFYQLVVKYVKGFCIMPERKEALHSLDIGRNKTDEDKLLFYTSKTGRLWRRGRDINDTSDQITEEYHTYTNLENTNCLVREPKAEGRRIHETTSVSNPSFLEVFENDKAQEDTDLLQKSQPTVFKGKSNISSSYMSTTSFLHWTFSVVVVLLMLRVLRRWNHTGNKWLDIPDFGDWLVK